MALPKVGQKWSFDNGYAVHIFFFNFFSKFKKPLISLNTTKQTYWQGSSTSKSRKEGLRQHHVQVYQACVLSKVLYGSETWTLYSHQERRLNTLHLRCLTRILSITWQDRVTNKNDLAQVGVPSMLTSFIQRRLG